MTKDDLEMNNDNERSSIKEESLPSTDLTLFSINFLGQFSGFFGGSSKNRRQSVKFVDSGGWANPCWW